MVASLIDMGVAVTRFDFHGQMRTHGKQIMNELLRNEFTNGPFDMVVYVPLEGTEVTEETWQCIEPGTPRVLWLFNDQWRFESFGREFCWSFEWVVTDDPQGPAKYQELGYGDTAVYLPRACRTAWFGTLPAADRPFDLAFVGQPYGYRGMMIQKIVSLLPPKSKVLIGNMGAGHFRWPDYVKAYQSAKIVLSLGKASQGDVWQIKTRDFEATASGALLLADSPLVEQVFKPRNEYVPFSTPEEAAEQATYYLKQAAKRKKVAKAGQDRTMREHDYRHRFEALFNHIQEIR